MMSTLTYRIRTLGPLMGDIAASATGSFSLMHSFGLVASGQEGPDAKLSVRTDRRSAKQFVGIGAALFILAFIASEAAATVVAFRH